MFLYQNSILVFYKKNELLHTRIGISVSKKVGKAHIRNKYKRAIREFFRQSNFKNLSMDVHIVVNSKKYSNIYENTDNFLVVLRKDLHKSFQKIESQ